ncbi:MAG: AraC family transcriptional regulator [Eubacterium sp.]|nr:AraC family transcriptional regulator [Eubacterium sp.]
MAISEFTGQIDRHGRELLVHGTIAFPVGCYEDDLHREEIPWHWHAELEAVVVAEGEVRLEAGEIDTRIRKGEGFFINTSVLHAVRPACEGICKLHSVVFHPRLVGGTSDSVFWSMYLRPVMEQSRMQFLHLRDSDSLTGESDTAWYQEALQVIESAWEKCSLEPDGYAFMVREDLSRLIWLVQSHLPSAPKRRTGKMERDEIRIKKMLEFIHTFYAEDISAGEIAGHAEISESECLRCFRSTIEMSPVQYLRQYRIQEAAKLLQTTDRKIAEIAFACGFHNVSYFSKTFREMKGCSPGSFRAGGDRQFCYEEK